MTFGTRGALAILGGFVYVVGVGVLMTVTTTNGEPLELVPALYHGLRLFILEIYGIPLEGPPGTIVGFWFAAFMAPALLAGKVLDYVRVAYAQAGHSFGFSWGRSEPVVVCGFGMHGRAVAAEAVSSGHRVVVVDMGDLGDGTGVVSVGTKRVRYVRGDFTTEGILRRAEVHRARQVWFCAGSPNVNLRAAWAAAGMKNTGESRELIPMVDEGWNVSALSDWANNNQVTPFVQFEQAARAILEANRFGFGLDGAALAGQKIAIIGFGRLGGAVLSLLADKAGVLAVSPTVRVIDPRAIGKVDTWKLRNPTRSSFVNVRPVAVSAEELAWANNDKPTVVFVCTSDDHTNMRLAHDLRVMDETRGSARSSEEGPRALIVLRMFDTQMAEMVTPPGVHEGPPRDLVAVSLESLVRGGVRERLAAPPRESHPTSPNHPQVGESP